MNTQVTLTLSDELYERARRWATIIQRDLSENAHRCPDHRADPRVHHAQAGKAGFFAFQ